MSVFSFDATQNRVDGDIEQYFQLAYASQPAANAERIGYWESVVQNLYFALDDLAYGHRDLLQAAMHSAVYEFQNLAIRDLVDGYIEDAALAAGTVGEDSFAPVQIGGHPEIVYLKEGNDTVHAHNGSDTIFVYFKSDGTDTVFKAAVDSNTLEKLILPDISASEVDFVRDGNDLVIGVKDTGQVIIVQGALGADPRPEVNDDLDVVTFSDKSFSAADIRQLLVDKGAENVGVYGGLDLGTDKPDYFQNAPGNDVLSGGTGADVYRFGHGPGDDIIIEVDDGTNVLGGHFGDNDTVSFAPNVKLSDVLWARLGDDLVIRLKGGNDSLTIRGEFQSGEYAPQVEFFQFASGRISLADVKQLLSDGTAGSDYILANGLTTSSTDISGGRGNDVLIGPSAGFDSESAKTYHFDLGDGHDVIIDAAATPETRNTIAFGPNITASQVHVQRFETHFVFTFDGSNDRIIYVDDRRYTSDPDYALHRQQFPIDKVTFTDGSEWSADDLWANATIVPNVELPAAALGQIDFDLATGSGYIPAYTLGGSSTFGKAYSLHLHGVSAADIDIQRTKFHSTPYGAQSGAAILISSKVSTANPLLVDTTTTDGVPLGQIVFDDGSVWSRAYIQAYLTQQASTSGDDHIEGFGWIDSNHSANDILIGGEGDDELVGSAGADTYIYSRGDGFDRIDARGSNIVRADGSESNGDDTLVFTNILSTEVTLQRVPNGYDVGSNEDLVINIDGANGQPDGQVRIAGQFEWFNATSDVAIENIVFSDGVVWHRDDIVSRLIAQQQTAGDDTIVGFNSDDVLQGGLGGDHLNGGVGDDTYIWTLGDGRDYIHDDAGGHDSLVLHGVLPSEVTVIRSQTDPLSTELYLRGSRLQAVVLDNQKDGFYSHNGIETVRFDDGTVWDFMDLVLKADGGENILAPSLVGTSGNDEIIGGDGNEGISGGAGDDILDGGPDNDTYFFGVGSGNDTIYEARNRPIDPSYFDADLYLTPWRTVDTVRLQGLNPGDVELVFGGPNNRQLDIVIKATGETLRVADHYSLASAINPTEEPGGGIGIERLIFADGTVWKPADMLAHSRYVGSDAAETITAWTRYSDETSNQIEGRGGDDLLVGTVGSDTYVWRPGDGNDTIKEDFYSQHTPIDTLWLKGVSASDVSLSRVGEDLRVTIVSTGEVITDFHHARGGIETIKFDDGTVWTRDNVLEKAGTADADYLFGTEGSDRLEGGAGSDDLRGWNGSDQYIWKMGDGNDTIRAEYAAETGAIDRLVLSNVAANGVTYSVREGVLYESAALVDIHVSSTGEVITVEVSPTGNFGVSKVVFSDGSEIELASSVLLPNLAPVAQPEYDFTTLPDQTLTISVAELLGNDFDPNNDALTIVSVSAQYGGTAALQPEGSVLFTPEVGYTGLATITYVVSDGVLESTSEFWVNIYSPQAPSTGDDYIDGTAAADTIDGLAGDDWIYGYEGNDTLIGGSGNDYLDGGSGADTYVVHRDPGAMDAVFEDYGETSEIDRLLLTGFTPSEAALSRVYGDFGQELWINLPDGQSVKIEGQFDGQGVDEIAFDDGTVWSREVIGNRSLRPDNQAPTTASLVEQAAGNEDRVISGILIPGIDPDNDALTFNLVEGSAVNGRVILIDAATGRYLFTPDANFSGQASFRYSVTDGIATSGEKTVAVTVTSVNDAPAVGDDVGFAATIDTPLTLLGSTLLANDSDADGGLLAISSVEAIWGGIATLDVSGNVVFMPSASYVGDAVLRYTVTDGQGGSSSAFVGITIEPSEGNYAPVVSGPTDVVVIEDNPYQGQVLASDPDGDGLSYTVKAGGEPQKGTIAIDQTGAFVYTPFANVNGQDTFTVVVSDGLGGVTERVVAVNITPVNDMPTAPPNINLTTNEDSSASGAINAVDIDGDAITYSIKSGAGPAHGTVSLQADGSFVYVPGVDFYGTDSFTVQFWSCPCGTPETIVTISVAPINDNPVATSDAGLSTNIDVPLTIVASTLLSNDTDVDGNALTITEVGSAQGGTVALDSNGNLVFTPSNAYTGPASFTYTVSDGHGGTSTATASLIVNAVAGQTFAGTSGNDTLTGGGGNDVFTLVGNGGTDQIDGRGGYDKIRGSIYNDVINVTSGLTNIVSIEEIDGGAGNDTIAGTTGDDVIDLSGYVLTSIENIDGKGGNDTIIGTSAADVITGNTGNDLLQGRGGNDVFQVVGDGGTDTVDGGDGVDTIRGSIYNDTFRVTSGLSNWTNIEALDGGAGSDTIAGTASNDTINVSGIALSSIENIDGGAGDDTIVGSAGGDTITGNTGNDTLSGGLGDDVFSIVGDGGTDTVDGGEGLDTIRGSIYNDVFRVTSGLANWSNVEAIDGGAGNDTIAGTTANDVINVAGIAITSIENIDGGAGDDTITGSSASDTITGGAGNDALSGGLGDDTFSVVGDGGTDTVDGGEGFDTIRGSIYNDVFRVTSGLTNWSNVEAIDGGAGNDTIAGTTANDVINVAGIAITSIENIDGGAGDDTITGSSASDTITGGADNDALSGGLGDDTFSVVGDGGTDTVDGGEGFDTIRGSIYNDVFRVTSGLTNWSNVEAIDGGAGNDTIAGTTANDVINVAGIAITSIENIDGGAGDDTITGSSGADTITGGAGNDALSGGLGDDVVQVVGDGGTDTVDGGEGFDTIRGSIYNDVFRVTSGLANWTNVEAIDGGAGNDTIAGTSGNDSFDFSALTLTGIEKIDTGAGSDRLIGSSGNDVLFGGAGSDTFVFNGGGVGRDAISDFAVSGANHDLLEFSSSLFSDWATLQAAISDTGAGAYIAFDFHNGVTLTGVTKAQLEANAGDDFRFV